MNKSQFSFWFLVFGYVFQSWIPYKPSTDGVSYVGRSSNSGPTEKGQSRFLFVGNVIDARKLLWP